MANCPWTEGLSENEEENDQSALLRQFYNGKRPEVRFGVNFRDTPEAFATHPERIYKVLEFVTTLPKVGKRWPNLYFQKQTLCRTESPSKIPKIFDVNKPITSKILLNLNAYLA